ERVIVEWLATLGAILAVFYVIDRRYYKRMPRAVQREVEAPDTWQFEGGMNVLLLLVIIGAVFLPAAFFLREIVMIGAAVASYKLTPRAVHAKNRFGFGPIKEV